MSSSNNPMAVLQALQRSPPNLARLVVVIDAEVLKKVLLELRALRRGTREPRTTADATRALLPFEESLQTVDR
jgi:hypothetical protein